ncbi:ubiquitin fusion degradation protein UFD1-domain-containing protein [Dipodascopsis tothii]|uniref:ubiquitin fusion degradation protein UFD1-domain-containing protein n=1 Tax=Dipodascopsis tothii TaxID=44089 RepID=UPI0034CE8039
MFGGYYDDDDNSGFGMDSWRAALGGRRAGFGAAPSRTFREYFRCYPVVMMPGAERRETVNYGGKIILPPSALNKLTRLNITYPMLFELKNEEVELTTHAGVLEFIAEEGRVYLPQWMMERLALDPGSLVVIASTSLPSGSFVKIEPQSPDFLDISDPKAVLENALRNFSTLTVDDIFEISYNSHVYRIRVLETKPAGRSGISVVETDLEVDFAPPVGYDEYLARQSVPQPVKTSDAITPLPHGQTMASVIGWDDLAVAPAAGVGAAPVSQGQRLSGKPLKSRSASATSSAASSGMHLNDVLASTSYTGRGNTSGAVKTVVPAPLRLPFGQLFFGYPVVPLPAKDTN